MKVAGDDNDHLPYKIEVLLPPEHNPPKVRFWIGHQGFDLNSGVGDFDEEDVKDGRLQWTADMLDRAFKRLLGKE